MLRRLFKTGIGQTSDGNFMWKAESYLFKDEEFMLAFGYPLTPDGEFYGGPFKTEDAADAALAQFSKAFYRACKKQFKVKVRYAPPPHTRN
jgi:hypothetical protein